MRQEGGARAVKRGAVGGSINQPWQTREGGAGGQQPAGDDERWPCRRTHAEAGGADKRGWHQSWKGVKGQDDAAEALVGERWRCWRFEAKALVDKRWWRQPPAVDADTLYRCSAARLRHWVLRL